METESRGDDGIGYANDRLDEQEMSDLQRRTGSARSEKKNIFLIDGQKYKRLDCESERSKVT